MLPLMLPKGLYPEEWKSDLTNSDMELSRLPLSASQFSATAVTDNTQVISAQESELNGSCVGLTGGKVFWERVGFYL